MLALGGTKSSSNHVSDHQTQILSILLLLCW